MFEGKSGRLKEAVCNPLDVVAVIFRLGAKLSQEVEAGVQVSVLKSF